MSKRRIKALRKQFLKEGKKDNEVLYNIRGEVVEESKWRKFKKDYANNNWKKENKVKS